MLWSSIAKGAILFGIVGGAVWWISEGRYDAGYRAGESDGYRRGAEAANRFNDQQMQTLLAESRAEAEKRLREAQDANRENERRMAAEIESARESERANLAAAAADRDRLLARLRAVRTRGPVPDTDRRRGLPEAGADQLAGAVPAGVLPEPDRESLVRLAYEAEWINGQFGICRRYAYSLRATP